MISKDYYSRQMTHKLLKALVYACHNIVDILGR